MLQFNIKFSFTLPYMIPMHKPFLCDEMKRVTKQKNLDIKLYTHSLPPSLSLYVCDIVKLTGHSKLSLMHQTAFR